MAGKRRKNDSIDWAGADRLEMLMAEQGLTPRDIQRISETTGKPDRAVSYRTVYRILESGHRPKGPVRYEIAAALNLKPSQIWSSDVDIPEVPALASRAELVAA